MARVEYIEEFYCGFCGRTVKQGEERRNGNNQARCPKDGNLLRSRPRGKNNSHKRAFERLGYLKEKGETY